MSLDALRPSERTVRRLRFVFLTLLIGSLVGLAVLGLLAWAGVLSLNHPVVYVLVGMLIIAGGLEFCLESLRQAGRHEDRWWRP